MRPGTDRAFRIPSARPVARWAWGAAVALHGVLALGIVWAVSMRVIDHEAPLLAPLLVSLSRPAAVEMRFRGGPPRPRSPEAAAPAAVPPAAPRPASLPFAPLLAPRTTGGAPGARLPAPTALPPGPAETVTRGSLAPSYGTGRLWVRPLPVSAREMAAAVTGKTQDQLADSVVAVVVQRYLDALAEERADPGNQPADWTTSLGGQKIGLDQKWVYLGPIRLPTILLGLLPINMQGNPTQAEMNKRFAAMREDLFYAARRAATLEEFKRNVAILRQQKQYEYDLRKAQRTLPDSGGPQ